jgi:hypothetical protein
MENETYRNIEVIWLLGDLKPDHWTICKFRRENKGLIRLVAIEFRKFLMDSGYIEGKTLVFDGSKMKADANLMKSRDWKMACYNVQTGVDAKHHMIAMAEVSTDECDINLIKTDFKNITEQLGFTPKEIEADKGYGNVDQIKEIQETSGTTCYIPMQEPPTKKQDRENNIEFIYKIDNDTFKCPNNKTLKLFSRNFKQDNQTYNIYKCHDCIGCPIKNKCTKSRTGRAIKVNVNHEWINNYREWIEKKENIEKVKQRRTIVEHPFGTIKMMMGKFCFLLRKKHKVQIEVDLYATAYNLKRLINIENMENLLKQVGKYNWKIV